MLHLGMIHQETSGLVLSAMLIMGETFKGREGAAELSNFSLSSGESGDFCLSSRKSQASPLMLILAL
ncbi:hypothetical protein HanRHA438_Chr03g0131281 [Helianthus annuus]|nr:hypothetical protein HanRHA438_Chr03g0131281 [Helianthus annuus]